MDNIVHKILLISFLFILTNGYGGQLVLNSSILQDNPTPCSVDYAPTASLDDTIPALSKEKKKKVQKNKVSFETFDQSYAKAVKYYNNEQFLSAARIFEELYPLSIGTPVADSILYYFADCYYMNKNYEMAAFHFKDYTRRFPSSPRAEDAYFKCVTSIYNLSPYYSLDQFETKYAIEEINLFAQIYHGSKYTDECNKMLDELRDKLAKKEFEIIRLYYYTDHYQAAQIATRNFLKDYSYSKYAPEAIQILVKNNFEYAKKSVDTKKAERYQTCIDAFEMLQINYPESPFIATVKQVADEATKNLNKIKNK